MSLHHQPQEVPTTALPAALSECEECGKPESPVCVECGEWAFESVRVGRFQWRIVPLDHSDCQEGLGWRKAQDGDECAYCQSLAERDDWYARNGHGFHCTCGCNGH